VARSGSGNKEFVVAVAVLTLSCHDFFPSLLLDVRLPWLFVSLKGRRSEVDRLDGLRVDGF
jgi:hypothetical protein